MLIIVVLLHSDPLVICPGGYDSQNTHGVSCYKVDEATSIQSSASCTSANLVAIESQAEFNVLTNGA